LLILLEKIKRPGHSRAALPHVRSAIFVRDQTDTVILSADHNQWGTYDYDVSKDVLRFNVPVREMPFTERLAFTFDDVDPDAFSASVLLCWESIGVSFEVTEP